MTTDTLSPVIDRTYTPNDLQMTIHAKAFDKVSSATYAIPGVTFTIEYNRFGTLVGTSKTRPFLFRGKGYANLKKALEALNQHVNPNHKPKMGFAGQLYALTDQCNTFLQGYLPQSPVVFLHPDTEGAYDESELDGLATGDYIDPKTGEVTPYRIVSVFRLDQSIQCTGYNAERNEQKTFALDYVRADQLPILCDRVEEAI